MVKVNLDLGQDDWGKVECDNFDSLMRAVVRMIRIEKIFGNK